MNGSVHAEDTEKNMQVTKVARALCTVKARLLGSACSPCVSFSLVHLRYHWPSSVMESSSRPAGWRKELGVRWRTWRSGWRRELGVG